MEEALLYFSKIGLLINNNKKYKFIFIFSFRAWYYKLIFNINH